MVERTQVGIVGAGPAGLLLGQLLQREGIETVVLEARTRAYVERRLRAGVFEQATVDLLAEAGVGERLRREGLVHRGLELRFDGRGHRIPVSELTGGRCVTIYGQTEVVKDLIAARLAAGGALRFAAEVVAVDDLTTARPVIRYRHDGAERELRCDVVAGCDGFHGVCRRSIPADRLQVRARETTLAWLGILAEVAPSTQEVVYARHERGFALHSMRSPTLSRLYLQCDVRDRLDAWPDARIWQELHVRLARDDGWQLAEGPIVGRSITPLRSLVVEPMRHGRLVLAGDAAHIVPPTGAKGLNLAAADVKLLVDALGDWYRRGDEAALAAYSEKALKRVWRTQHFCWWMTSMLHRFDDGDGFTPALQRAQLEQLCSSRAAATVLAENFTGLPWDA